MVAPTVGNERALTMAYWLDIIGVGAGKVARSRVVKLSYCIRGNAHAAPDLALQLYVRLLRRHIGLFEFPKQLVAAHNGSV